MLASIKSKPIAKLFLALPVCVIKGDRDENAIGFYKAVDVIGMYPGWYWGSIVLMQNGHSVLTTLVPKEVLAKLDPLSFCALPTLLQGETGEDKKEVNGYYKTRHISGLSPAPDAQTSVTLSNGLSFISTVSPDIVLKAMTAAETLKNT